MEVVPATEGVSLPRRTHLNDFSSVIVRHHYLRTYDARSTYRLLLTQKSQNIQNLYDGCQNSDSFNRDLFNITVWESSLLKHNSILN